MRCVEVRRRTVLADASSYAASARAHPAVQAAAFLTLAAGLTLAVGGPWALLLLVPVVPP